MSFFSSHACGASLKGIDGFRYAAYRAARCITLRQNAVTSKERLTVNLEHDEYSEIEALAKQHNVSKA